MGKEATKISSKKFNRLNAVFFGIFVLNLGELGDFENRKCYKLNYFNNCNMFPVIFKGHWTTFFGGAF